MMFNIVLGGSEWCKEDTIGLNTTDENKGKSVGTVSADSTMLVSPGEIRSFIIQTNIQAINHLYVKYE